MIIYDETASYYRDEMETHLQKAMHCQARVISLLVLQYPFGSDDDVQLKKDTEHIINEITKLRDVLLHLTQLQWLV